MIKNFISLQFLGFIAVGMTAALANWFSRWLLNDILGFSLAVICAYGVGVTCAFILNRIFVFTRVNRPLFHQARDFFLVNALAFPIVYLSAIIIRYFLIFCGMENHAEDLAHAISLGIPMLGTFLIYKFFTFRSIEE